MKTRSITPDITIADQPTPEELESLPGEGYVGVINLRNDGEPDQPMSTAAEGEKVRALGLDYLHYGVGAAPLSEGGVESVAAFLNRHAGGKVLVHCRRGPRAAALVLIHQVKAQGWTPETAFQEGRALGLEVDGGLRTLVENYLREHPPGTKEAGLPG